LIASDAERGLAATCVIVTYHRAAMARRLVARLQHPRLTVVVVNIEDDAEIRRLSGAIVVSTAQNVGYARGINLGVAHSTAGVIVFMNDDVETTADQVLELADHVIHGLADVAVPLVEDAHGRLELGNRPPLKLASRMLLRGDPVPTGAITVDAAWAVMVAVRADVVRAIPLPDSYFLYWEEFDWFFQLRRDRKVVQVVPWVRIRHLVGTLAARPEKSRLLARNAVRCVRRTRGRWPALRAWPVVIAWQLGRCVRSAVRAHPSELRAHLAGVQAAVGSWREI
jgi:GT2 family glycosyltransferase